MDITTILTALISALLGGGLITIFTLRETRKSLQIDNQKKEDDRWSKLCDEQQDQIEKLNERLEKKDGRIMELEDRCTNLSTKLDEVNTDLAKATLLKCSRIACQTRIPPFGYRDVDLDKPE